MKKTVVILDLKGYGDVARELEEQISAGVVIKLKDQIQSFVNEGLEIAGVDPNHAKLDETGDGTVLMFETPSAAHVFAEAVHQATHRHNDGKTRDPAKRWFRIGIATGDFAIQEGSGIERKYGGFVVTRAARLEAACRTGETLIDSETYAGLTREQQAAYGSEEQIAGKRGEKFSGRRSRPAFGAPISSFGGPVGELIAQRMLSPPSRPGLLAILDHFEILRFLGGGGMGIVLLARDSDTGRDVAIKLVKSDLVTNQHVVHRFLKEAGHLKRLRHTNIVTVQEISNRAEGPYFVMPYFEKGSLANRI
jgi:hypothetical protein